MVILLFATVTCILKEEWVCEEKKKTQPKRHACLEKLSIAVPSKSNGRTHSGRVIWVFVYVVLIRQLRLDLTDGVVQCFSQKYIFLPKKHPTKLRACIRFEEAEKLADLVQTTWTAGRGAPP